MTSLAKSAWKPHGYSCLMWKTERFPFRLRSETRMSVFSTGLVNRVSKKKKKKKWSKRHWEWEWRSETLSHCRWHHLYIGNPKESVKKLWKPINELSKVVGYKVKIEKPVLFLYPCNGPSKNESMKTIPFMMVSKWIKWYKFSKEVQYLL